MHCYRGRVYYYCSRCLWFVGVEHVECPQEVEFPAPLLKYVSPAQSLGRVHQCLFHAGRVDVGVVDGPEEKRHGARDDRGSHAGATEGAAATVEGGASDARAVGDDVWLHPTVTCWQLLMGQ